MDSRLKVACIQLCSTNNIETNLDTVTLAIRQAGQQGVQLIATPENTCLMEHNSQERLKKAFTEATHPGIPLFQKLSQEFHCWLLIGSLTIKGQDNLCYNRSYLFGPQGNIVAKYDKIHLFDANLPDGKYFRESQAFHAGNKPIIAETPWGGLGLSICYDLRFPYLYRYLAQHSAKIIAVPSAFIKTTGEAHWHVLLRARAIETGCFIIAPAQAGTHSDGRQTYGHSLIIDPWGRILAEAGIKPEIIYADIDLNQVAQVHQQIPAWEFNRSHILENK